MSAWHEGRLLATRPAASGLWTVRVDVSQTPLVGSHTLPGQYLLLAIGELREAAFAIASGPDEQGEVFELLVKEGSPVTDLLVRAPEGTPVRLGKPRGPGFPLEKAAGKRLLLFATGSGISAIRSVIESLRKDRARYGEVTLYFGARSPTAFAYRDQLDAWERAGIRVARTVSQPDGEQWEGTTGYVQALLADESLGDAVAFVCGQREMVEAVREALVSRGMPPENVFLNF